MSHGWRVLGVMVLITPVYGAVEIPFAKVGKVGKYEWKNEWNHHISDAIEAHGHALLDANFVPKEDASLLCSNFYNATDDERKTFWALLFASIARYESGYNPKLKYMESWGVYSEGLLQLSYGDETRHKPCDIDQLEKNIHDPKVNLHCGVTIMVNQIKKRGRLFPPTSYYWAVLTKKKKQIINYFRLYSPQLDFC